MTTALKTLWKNDNTKNFTEIFKYNNRTFKIHIEHRNGDPIGFNSNCALYIMIENGTFSGIIDSRECGIKYSNLYYSDNTNEIIKINTQAINEFKEFVKKVYG